MNYQHTLDYLYAQLPMFHRIGPAAYKANLDNTIALADYFDNPQHKFKSIHIAGTNGKGSVAHMLASVFQEAGYKTGLCTSPHLKDFRERFRINGGIMPEQFITDFVNNHKDFFQTLQPSFFELTIAMTFDYFAREKVDIAIIETGLGGRLDSTNIITPELSVITNVGLDHTNLLGDTIEAIAKEKAGIIKKGVPVIAGKCRQEAAIVFEHKAKVANTSIMFADQNYQVVESAVLVKDNQPFLRLTVNGNGVLRNVDSALTGTYQLENILTALAAVDLINRKGNFRIPEEALKAGLRNVISNTGIAGRWQVIERNPLVICDTGHNADGIKSIMENIRQTPHKHLHFVLGMMNDKDISGILQLLPCDHTTYYFCRPDVPRGLDTGLLRQTAIDSGLEGKAYSSVGEALAAAKNAAGRGDLIFVGGSTFVVAEVV
ncbi:MAG: bifunctional folylpolyglutamate synthase/dihydrofolate synthase [Bacteroidetes bacterium]|nr:MAG: bifunctional folylpolyglutamate synthase/dihydrofolate synthase [Bacteroidota bacterium]